MNETENPRNERENGSPAERTLTVQVASAEAAFDELEQRLAAHDAGEGPSPCMKSSSSTRRT